MPKQTCLQRCAGVWARGGNSGYGQLKGGHYHSETDDLSACFTVPEWGAFCHTARLRNRPLASPEFDLTVPLSELPRRYGLIRVVTLHATVMASGSLSYLVGCGMKADHSHI